MLLRDFYEHTLPPSGIYALFSSKSKSHVWCSSVDELVAATERLSDANDTYFAVETFKQAGEDAYSGRTQANVDRLKCFRLDLDAGQTKLAKHGPEKIYATQEDAIRAVIDFTRTTGLMFSLLVSSGEGLHVYYELNEAVEPDKWQPAAKQFQAFGKGNGLKIDSSVTSDHARVLRPIGTRHPNGKLVHLIKASGKVYSFDEFCNTIDHVPEPAQPFWDMSVNEDILPVQGPPKSFAKVLQQCATIRWAAENQAKTDEPYWRAVLGVTKHTVEGIEAAISVSNQHPSYDIDELTEKFDRWETGPSTCLTFSDHNPTACAGCPHKGKLTSPIQLGVMTVTEVEKLPEEKQPAPPPPKPAKGKPWDGMLPKGFDVFFHKGHETLVHYMTIEKETESGERTSSVITVPITTDIFWFGTWADADNTDDTAQVTVHKQDGHLVKSYQMEQALVASRSDLLKFLAGKGIHLTTDRRAVQAMENYAKAQLLRIKNTNRQQKVLDHFGLHALPDGKLTATQGNVLINGNGVIERPILGPALRSYAGKYCMPLPPTDDVVWPTSVWKTHLMEAARQHVQFMRDHYTTPEMAKHRLAIMLGIASPLMAFVTGSWMPGDQLPPNGLTVSLYSRNGGKGKSTAMATAQMAYGPPRTQDQNTDGATALARIAMLSMSGTMPINMDEMGNTAEVAIRNLINNVANGTGRSRLTSKGELVSAAPWSLICLIGTNRSQRDMITAAQEESSAVQYRLIELDVNDVPSASVEAQMAHKDAFAKVAPCAGGLGAVIHLMICNKGLAAMNELVGKRVTEASGILQSDEAETASRFQYRALGAALALHDMLSERDLQPFDRDELIATFKEAYDAGREYVKENVVPTDGLEILSRMLQEFAPNTAITYGETRRSRTVSMYDMDVRKQAPKEVWARHVIDSGRTYVAVEALKRWCLANKMRDTEILYAARAHGVQCRVYASNTLSSATVESGVSQKRWAQKFNLLKGMSESVGIQVLCYAFDVKQLAAITGDEPYDGELPREVNEQGNVVQLVPAA